MAGSGPDDLSVRAISGVEVGADDLAGLSLQDSLSQLVVETGEPVSVSDVNEQDRALSVSALPGWPAIGPVNVVPLGSSSSSTRGALALGWTPDRADFHGTVAAQLPATFARQAALAGQVAQAREDQQRLAVFEDRDRIERDLHDRVIQRLFAVGLGLQVPDDRADVQD